jgi:hypothetical protein
MSATGRRENNVRSRKVGRGDGQIKTFKDETNQSAHKWLNGMGHEQAVRTCQAPDEVEWHFILIFEYAPP